MISYQILHCFRGKDWIWEIEKCKRLRCQGSEKSGLEIFGLDIESGYPGGFPGSEQARETLYHGGTIAIASKWFLNLKFPKNELKKSFLPKKVETIGDAYMVVAGIPPPKDQSVLAQNRHVDTIANVALSMRKFLSGYEIPHRRKERVK